MKKLMLVAVVSAEMFCVEACQYYVRNLADDSFSVSITAPDQRVVISSLLTNTDPSVIVGCREQPCGKGSVRKEKRYDVRFKDGYVPTTGEEPFITFKNDKGEFRIVFFDEYYAELQSDMASEIHDDPGRRESELLYRGEPSSYQTSEEYDGNVRHWMVFGPYVGVYCYERCAFPRRCIDICEALDDNSWIQTKKEVDLDYYVGFNTPHRHVQLPQQHWWSRFCCNSGD